MYYNKTSIELVITDNILKIYQTKVENERFYSIVKTTTINTFGKLELESMYKHYNSPFY